jgi:fibronectin-binding autotransporter adhesin
MRVRQVVGLVILLCGFQSVRTYGQAVATWTDSSGNWSNAANWSTSTVPNDGGGTFYNAVINGTGSDTITFDASGTVVNSLMIGPGETFQSNGLASTLTVGDLSFASPGALANKGTVNWGNGATLNLANGGVNNGTINVTGTSGLVLGGVFENYGTLDVNHSSLTGSYNNIGGSTGFNPATGTLIIENGSTAALAVLGSFSNTGPVIIVRNNSFLTAGFLYNFNSRLEALSGSVVTIGGIDNTNGGLFVDNSTMNFSAGYGTAGPTGGNVTVQNGGTLNVIGAFSDNPFSYTSITGRSVVNIRGALNNSLSNNFTVDNSVLNVGGDLVNVEAQAILQNNSIGVIGGSLSNGSVSTITVDQSTLTVRGNVDNGGFANLTIRNSATLNVFGNISNDNSGAMTLGGGSTVNVVGTFANNQGAALTMSGTNDVLNVQGSFTNAGGVTVGTLETLNATGGFTNSGGNVSVSSGGALITPNYSQSSGLTDISGNLTSHSYSQTGGNTTIETGGKLSATTFTATGGTVTVNGTLDPAAVEIGSGAGLRGTGTIIGNVVMGGTIMPGAPGTPGTFTIVGNYEQLSGGMLQEFMGPLSQSFLNVKGAVALDSGSFLDIILLNGYDPLGQTFSVMDYNSLVGEFSNGSIFWQDGYQWDVSYGQHGIDVTAVSTPEPSSRLLLFIGLVTLAFFSQRKIGKTQRLA